MAFLTPVVLLSSTTPSIQHLRPSINPLRRPPLPRLPNLTPRMTSASTTTTQYDALAAFTTIVEDTGDIASIAAHRPHSATTNPTLVAKAAANPTYAPIVEEAVAYARQHAHGYTPEATLSLVRNKLFTLFGARILDHVPGDVSTEVDARLSFDVDAQVDVAKQIIAMYAQEGIHSDRVLIKLASTWEGIQACRILQAQGIRTNMTLLFSMAQAAAAADANAYLISPFVGRILDWYKNRDGPDAYINPADDPGVISVRNIYNYYKCIGSDTIVMGASFRNKGEILHLAGCDRLTIAPKFIADMKQSTDPVTRMLAPPGDSVCTTVDKMQVDEISFRWMMNEDAMATEKLAHGIRSFAADLRKLDAQLQPLLLH